MFTYSIVTLYTMFAALYHSNIYLNEVCHYQTIIYTDLFIYLSMYLCEMN